MHVNGLALADLLSTIKTTALVACLWTASAYENARAQYHEGCHFASRNQIEPVSVKRRYNKHLEHRDVKQLIELEVKEILAMPKSKLTSILKETAAEYEGKACIAHTKKQKLDPCSSRVMET